MARTKSKVTLVIAGVAVAAAGAAAALKRDKVAALLPSRSGGEGGADPTPPQPSNYDAPGPVANTATPIPAPDPHGEPPAHIDPVAEEAAAAAEAAAIGGSPTEYAGDELGEPADEAFRPLAEAGEGEAEGQEQAEADLADNATYRDAGSSDAERQIDEAIEEAGQPSAGETPEPLPSTPVDETAEDVPGGGISGRPFAGLEDAPDTPGAPPTGSPDAPPTEGVQPPVTETPGTPPTGAGDDDDGGAEYRTWSGRSVEP
jgi:hypothetical protein